jgi:hypothetical protein
MTSRLSVPSSWSGNGPPVYVDAAIHGWRGRLWCHLFCADLERLHLFARSVGLHRAWFQEPPEASWPHYDTTAQRRERALLKGAMVADRWTLLLVRDEALLEWCRIHRPDLVQDKEAVRMTNLARHRAHLSRLANSDSGQAHDQTAANE